MRKLLILVALLLPIVVISQESKMSADEEAIRAGAAKLQEGWNSGSGKTFAEPFAKDADYVIVNGQYIKGHQVIEQAHQQIFDTVYKGTKLDFKVERVRFIRPDVAVVHYAGHRNNNDGSKDYGRATMIWVKNDGVWKIEAFHNTPVIQPPGE